MKLFQINYLEDEDEGSYLTVADDAMTEEDVQKREMDNRDWDCLYYLYATEITEVDGHRIIVED